MLSRSLLFALLGLSLLTACGAASRARFANIEISKSRGSPEILAEVRGYEPLLPGIWAYSVAAAANNGSPEEALRLLERGLTFQPRDTDLQLMRVNLLMSMGRAQEGSEAIAAGLASMPIPQAEAWLRAARIGELLAMNDLEAAEAETIILGGVRDVPPSMVAASWAQIALVAEILGQRERADAAMDLSLDRGPGARPALLEATVMAPERQAADRNLRRRSALRHPNNVDMALSLIVDQMVAGELSEAEAAISDLPEPVPARLAQEIFALHARIVLLQERTQEGLALLTEQLNQNPGNSFALEVLLEAWLNREQFQDQEVYEVLEQCWQRLRPGPTRSKIEAALQEVMSRIRNEEAERPLPPTNSLPPNAQN
ncbi:MAG: hypothetical protein P8N09_06000 [Planctomycetota bacterium]|nr:hypothetical protein [Planctomycetota bacterium]